VSEPPQPKPLVEYPGVYAFKVMGRLEHGFAAHVRALFSRLMEGEVAGDAIAENVSRQGNYVSLTVSVLLRSEEQRQAIYRHLHEDPRVLYYL
jgi:putative lipoic acid-binding regulatory protein